MQSLTWVLKCSNLRFSMQGQFWHLLSLPYGPLVSVLLSSPWNWHRRPDIAGTLNLCASRRDPTGKSAENSYWRWCEEVGTPLSHSFLKTCIASIPVLFCLIGHCLIDFWSQGVTANSLHSVTCFKRGECRKHVKGTRCYAWHQPSISFFSKGLIFGRFTGS